MLRTAEKYIWGEMGVQMPKGEINGEWFAENGLPMIVRCAGHGCGTTMALPSAVVDYNGKCYCRNCVDEEFIRG